MLAVIQKWDDSLGLQFPPVIKPSTTGKKYSLEELVAKMPSDYKPHEENWGPPVGKEVW